MNDWSDYVRQAERDFIVLGKQHLIELVAKQRMDDDLTRELEYQRFRESVSKSRTHRLDDEGMLERKEREREERRAIAEEANDDRLIDEMKEARHAYR